MIVDGLPRAVATNKVLIVDDNEINRLILAKILEECTLDIIEATNGQEAVELFEEHFPSVVLMDITMPLMDGIESTKLIKAIAGDVYIPVIFLTGQEGDSVLQEAIAAGGADFIRRPFSPAVIKAKIQYIQRMTSLIHQVESMYNIRKREEELAEQIFSGAVEQGNVALDQVQLAKRAAETFSGDVQLTAWRPNGELNVLLGDFTGHGLTSVVGALPLAETFRAMTHKGFGAEEILIQINQKLNALLPTGMFLAATWVTISPHGHCLVWNGGMPDVLRLDTLGQIKERVISGDPPLGILRKVADLNFTMTEMDEDDRLLLMSDGLLEARNPDDQYFGEQRMLNAVQDGCSQGSLLNTLMQTLDTFLCQRAQDDDISLIEIPARIKREDQEISLPSVSPKKDTPFVGDALAWEWGLTLNGSRLRTVNPVALALSHLQEVEGHGPHWHHVFTVLTELYINALDHGVMRLSSDLKDSPEGFTAYFEEREARLAQLHKDDYVSIHIEVTREGETGVLKIHVKDSGVGFDYFGTAQVRAQVLVADNVFSLSGRGILLVEDLCQSLDYSEGGTLAHAVYQWSESAA